MMRYETMMARGEKGLSAPGHLFVGAGMMMRRNPLCLKVYTNC